MALELHIWGPGLGLPSIDARSLATIVLLESTSPLQGWKLIASQPDSNPFSELPALKHDSLWIAGFRNIAKYIHENIRLQRPLDENLSDHQVAESEAYLAFLESRGQPLIDISLYASSDNYTTCTRDALGKILQWPRSWSIPHQLRDKARKRSEHLGLSRLDVDTTQEKELKEENKGMSAQIPKSLRIPKKTVSSLLGSTAQQTRFRIEAICIEFFEPLEERLEQHKWLLGDFMATVDCLAIGLIAQMQLRDLPQPWLSEILERKHSVVDKWAKKHVQNLLGIQPALEATAITSNGDLFPGLPWEPVHERSWQDFGTAILRTLIGSIPLLSKSSPVLDRSSASKKGARLEKFQEKHMLLVLRRRQQLIRQEVIAASFASVAVLGSFFYTGLLAFPKRQPRPMRRHFGDAGAFLGLG